MPPKTKRASQKSVSSTQASQEEESSDSSANSSSYEDSEDDSNGESSSTPRRKSKQGKKSNTSTKSPKELSEKDIRDLVNNCIYYILLMDRRYAIKKIDLSKHVLKDHKKNFNVIISRANEQLKKFYGIKMEEVAEKSGQYILVCVDPALKMNTWNANEMHCQALVYYILTVIWMKGGTLREEDLWKYLNVLDSSLDVEVNRPHRVFGDVRKFVTSELVKRLYITYEKVTIDPPIYEFQWGRRAELEIDKKVMLDYVCKIYGNSPKDWIPQYKEIEAKEKS